MDIKGTYSKEELTHFRCGSCNKWWSIGDVHDQKEFFCPWCGEKQVFTETK